jgi:tetratricopeptide (TPR) repeat protein
MSDPFSRIDPALTDALLQLDQAISIAEANVATARQLGLPEAQDLGMRLPYLVDRARRFLAGMPDMSQPQRWGESRRLLEQARAFGPFFAPYLALGQRITAYKQALQDQEARRKAASEHAARARLQHDVDQAAELVRRRLSQLRQTYADMQIQRGPGFDDQQWRDAVRAVGSILAAQDTRIAAAQSADRAGNLTQAQEQYDQTLGELQGGLDLAQRSRLAAASRAQARLVQGLATITETGETHYQPLPTPSPFTVTPLPATPATSPATSVTLIEVRTGTLFRVEQRAAVIGRGLAVPQAPSEAYLDLSRACAPGEADSLGVSRRHAEVALMDGFFAIRDLGSTNGTRLRHGGTSEWTTLVQHQWTPLRDGDVLQFGLLECRVSIT